MSQIQTIHLYDRQLFSKIFVLTIEGDSMRITICILIISFLTACGDSNHGESAQSKSQGQFTGSLNQQAIDVAVRCRAFNENYFSFHSDASQTDDSNGDGIVLNGFQMKNKLAFDIRTKDGFYSTPNLSEFDKKDQQASGSGNLYPESGGKQIPVKFTVSCP
jgi:hypothetical protein